MKHIFIFLALTFSSYSFATDVPCGKSLEQEIKRAQVILIGEIESHELNAKGVGDINFKVLRQWKGEPVKKIKIFANERFPFAIAQSGYYLIYANWATHTEKPFWQIPWCKQILDVTYAADDLAALGKAKYVNE